MYKFPLENISFTKCRHYLGLDHEAAQCRTIYLSEYILAYKRYLFSATLSVTPDVGGFFFEGGGPSKSRFKDCFLFSCLLYLIFRAYVDVEITLLSKLFFSTCMYLDGKEFLTQHRRKPTVGPLTIVPRHSIIDNRMI